ncbi:MAG: hypothetical protein AABN34_00250 [Acidobacteriota bacterium]
MAISDLDTIGRTPTPQQAAARAKLEKLIVESGAKPLTIEELNAMGDLWPEDESVDDFLEWREQMRKEDKSRRLP